MKTRTFLMIVVGFLSTTLVGAQRHSLYNLNKVDLELLNGNVISGELLDIVGDSVMIHDKYELVPGCRVTFRLYGVLIEYGGMVEAVNETTLTIKLDETPNVANVIRRSQIDNIRVTQPPLDGGSHSSKRTTISVTTIKSIQLHKKNAGGIGFGIGGLVGALVGASITPPPETPTTLSSAITLPYEQAAKSAGYILGGVVVGGFLGMAIGSSGRKHEINGSPEALQAFAKLVNR